MGYNGINNKYYKRKEPIAWKKQKETLYRLSDNFISQEPEKGMPVPENSIELVVKMINICGDGHQEMQGRKRADGISAKIRRRRCTKC